MTETGLSARVKSSLKVDRTVTAVSPACPAGTYVVGGGANIVQGHNIIALASSLASNPLLAGTWRVTAVTLISGHSHPGSIQAFAICAK